LSSPLHNIQIKAYLKSSSLRTPPPLCGYTSIVSPRLSVPTLPFILALRLLANAGLESSVPQGSAWQDGVWTVPWVCTMKGWPRQWKINLIEKGNPNWDELVLEYDD